MRTAPLRSRLTAPVLLIAASVLAGAIILGVQAAQSGVESAQQRATQTALTYSKNTMVWEKGPSVQSSRVIPLNHLAAHVKTLKGTVRHDVNTGSLIQRFGAARAVDFVVLYGKFNTLPPDEGVDVYAQVLVLVDMRTRHVLFMQN
jgi:hypothetical protein